MAHYITEPCVNVKDSACVDVCPVDCIHPTKEEADFNKVDQLFIDNSVCIDCGACVQACPVKAIFPLEDVPAEWHSYIEKNDSHFRK